MENLVKKKKKLINNKKNIFALSATILFSSLVIATPPIVVSLLPSKNPLFEVQNQAKLISNVDLKHEFDSTKFSYLEIKKQLFNVDGTKKTNVNFTDFFNFFQKNNNNLPIDFATDQEWSRFKVEIVDIDPVDKEQSFIVYYRLLQDLGDQKIAKSDLYKKKIAYNFASNYSLSNFVDLAQRKLSKLRTFSNQEFSSSTEKEITKLTFIDDFFEKVNSASSPVEAQKILGKYFNIEEIFEEIFSFKKNYFRDETGNFKPLYQIEIAKDPLLNLEYLSKAPKENQYNLTFKASFSPSFIEQNQDNPQKDSKFPFVVTLDLSNKFLDKSVANNINLTEFSQDDYYFPQSQQNNTENGVTSWDFFNYFNNQIFATQEDKQKFLDNILAKALKTSFLSKLEFSSELDGLDLGQVSKFLDIEIKIDSEMTKLAFDKGEVIAKVVGKIIIKNKKDQKIIAQKDFVQNVQNLEVIAQNDPQLAQKVKTTQFKFEPKSTLRINDPYGLPRNEIIKLIETNNFDKLKSILENGNYYGYNFEEDKLKALINNFELLSIEEFNKNSKINYIKGGKEQKTKVINFLNPAFKGTTETSRFFGALAKKGINFVAKFWFDYLKHLNLIESPTELSANLNSKNIFSELSKIKLNTKQPEITDQTPEKGIWLVTFNTDHLSDNEHLNNSFYIDKKFDKILELIKSNSNSNSNLDANYFLEQIFLTTKTVGDKDFLSQIDNSNTTMSSLADFLVGFYYLVFKKNGQFLTEPLGKNYDYKIQFAIEPVLASVASTAGVTSEPKLTLKYWYKVGPVDEKGNLISTIFETKQTELELKTNQKGILLTDEVQKLDEIAREFPTVSQYTFLTEKDYNDLLAKMKEAVKGKIGKLVDVSDLIKKFPFYRYFTTNYPGFGLYVFEKSWGKEQTNGIRGILESSDPVGGNQKQFNFWLYAYNKAYNKNRPWRRSSVPIKVIIIQHNESLLLS
ncbi:P97 family adhesin [Mycoplasma sp. 'Moose RK']|uniref:P97 family adhesin n=1 Tax=Mycoplasma sp. 'Moose RK' TaxID=2780095 RepID=UPI0018C1F984|nr:hypothetical protein [Mycoplasma sp. 'Moose RK']MBG0730962.1 hypothetical protein [Mycoplasma sp. 'Moose RK']